MSIALRDPPDLAGDGGGIVARRAVMRWGWRLFRREWRQQLLVLGLLTMAAAATIWGASVVTNVQLPNPNYVTFGTAAALVTLPGSDPHLAGDIAAIQGSWGPADLVENQDIATGTTQPVQLRAENRHGRYNSPLLSLVSGSYPAGPGQVALTSQVASLYGTHVGGTWQAAGTSWRVTGIVQDPSNLADEFALAAPGQVPHPSQVTLFLGSSPAVQQAVSNGNRTLPGMPAAATFAFPSAFVSGLPSATVVLVVEVLGLVFIGLVSVAGFSVMAQRRLRALGMLGAIGATERNLRLVMIVNGLAVGVAAALAGAVLGLAAWFAYVPTLQQATGHVIDAANLPWWAFAIGVVLAIATSVLASRRPAKTMAAVPVVAALSGRPAPPRALHRSALPGVIVFAVGVACLAFTGGLAGVTGQGHAGQGRALLLLAGLVAVIVGIVLLAPLAISVLAAGARPRMPVAIRIALRDLVRYRARSGAALAATTFAVFAAMGICLVASIKFDNPLNWTGPNLSGSQLIIYTQQSQGGGLITQLSSAQAARLGGQVSSLAASLHTRSVATGIPGHAVPGGHAAKQPVQLHRHRVRGHPAAARRVRDQDQPDRSGHRHPHHAARTSGRAAPGDDLEHHPVPGPRPSLHAEQRLPGQPRDTDGQRPAQRHLRAEHADHPVRGEQVPPAGQPERLADPGTGPAHRRPDQRRQPARARPRRDGRDQVQCAGSGRVRQRRHRAGHRDRARRAGRLRRPAPKRDRARPAHAHRHRRQRRDPADDHRGDRRRAGPARRDPRHGRRGDRRAGLGAQQPVRHVRRPAAG